MLRYAEAPYAHGIRKKSVPLRYARAQNAHVEKKYFSLRYATKSYAHVHFYKIVTLRNDVICTRPISKEKLVSLRNDVK